MCCSRCTRKGFLCFAPLARAKERARARAEAERQRASERFANCFYSGAAFGDFASYVLCMLLRTFAVASWQCGASRE